MDEEKTLVWIGSSKKDLLKMPEEVRRTIGYVLGKVQNGESDEAIKFLTGRKEFKGGKVREICDDEGGDTYRSVFTVEHEEAVYILHCFQKKSKRGIETPQEDIDRIIERLKSVDRFRASPDGLNLIAGCKADKTRQ
jgi:phage-related protein